MKRYWMILLALLMLLNTTALAQESAVTVVGENAGEVYLPEGSDEQTARYIYRYSYPRVEETNEVTQMINDFYTYLVDDAMNFAVPMAYESLEENDVQAYTSITSEVTCITGEYFGVLVTTESFMGAETSQIIAGHTFALTGNKAGTCISLPYLLKLLADNESDTWMQDRATANADKLVYDLVWDIIEQQRAAGTVAYYDDLTREELEAQFYPEEDFYLDENGNPVFYVQASYLASSAEGVLLFPFTVEELLDEL